MDNIIKWILTGIVIEGAISITIAILVGKFYRANITVSPPAQAVSTGPTIVINLPEGAETLKKLSGEFPGIDKLNSTKAILWFTVFNKVMNDVNEDSESATYAANEAIEKCFGESQ